MRTIGKLIVAGVFVLAVLQVVRPGIPVKPASAELQTSPDVKRILEKDCYSCHSNERRLAWFDQIVPAYWLVRHDILTAREHLNFSTLGSKPPAAQKAVLYEAVNMIQLGAMPLPGFLKLHPEAKVTAEELSILKQDLAPWAPAPNPINNAQQPNNGKTDISASTVSSEIPTRVSMASVSPEFDGLAFDPSFESWKLISITDRGDNNTFRFILGNDAAMKAALTGNTSPWPDGTRFAKIAWQQHLGADGLVHPGNFVQVELMVKNAQRYENTEGWGWGRWRGVDLTPYGKDADFVNECTGCHRPLRGNDYVYTLPISPAKVDRDEVINNAAALPASLPYQPLNWAAITMYVDPRARTMATLYGNDAAMRARLADQVAPAGAVLALVTWPQRDDPHWFGARIPSTPQSVEFVQITDPAQAGVYRRFAGPGLVEDSSAVNSAPQRTNFMLSLAPATLP